VTGPTAEVTCFARDPDGDVYLVRLDDLDHMHHWAVPARVVVDARADRTPPLPVLAQLVLLRRRLRAAGGDLVLAASPATAASLLSTGLHWVMPAGDDLSGAVDAVRRAAGPSTRR
jgi:hypothetical protein